MLVPFYSPASFLNRSLSKGSMVPRFGDYCPAAVRTALPVGCVWAYVFTLGSMPGRVIAGGCLWVFKSCQPVPEGQSHLNPARNECCFPFGAVRVRVRLCRSR